jgi:hypothetical protein
MKAYVAQGMTLEAIGGAEGLTRERARQLLHLHGLFAEWQAARGVARADNKVAAKEKERERAKAKRKYGDKTVYWECRRKEFYEKHYARCLDYVERGLSTNEIKELENISSGAVALRLQMLGLYDQWKEIRRVKLTEKYGEVPELWARKRQPRSNTGN